MDKPPFAKAWLKAEGLGADFQRQVQSLWRPLALRILEAKAPGRMHVVGLCGPQGSGKSTGALALEGLINADGLSVARLSIDDLYLDREARRQLSRTIHPLLATRGPPGTHDAALGVKLLDALSGPGWTSLPRFDKAHDDRAPEAEWPKLRGPVDVVIFEGWCVGARPQPPDALDTPINALEAIEDPRGVWRHYVNDALARYQTLFDRIDQLIVLRAPSFETVLSWREEQETKLRAQPKAGAGVMNSAEVARFVEHYERLTRWIEAETPARADVTVSLGADRAVLGVLVR